MKFIFLSALLFICLVDLEVASGQLEVVVKQEDYNRQALERVCCLITQSRCTTNCAGQSCTATCAGNLYGTPTNVIMQQTS